MSVMLTGDLVQIEMFKADAVDGTDYLEFRDITLPKDDPDAAYAIVLNKTNRNQLIALLLEVDR